MHRRNSAGVHVLGTRAPTQVSRKNVALDELLSTKSAVSVVGGEVLTARRKKLASSSKHSVHT